MSRGGNPIVLIITHFTFTAHVESSYYGIYLRMAEGGCLRLQPNYANNVTLYSMPHPANERNDARLTAQRYGWYYVVYFILVLLQPPCFLLDPEIPR